MSGATGCVQHPFAFASPPIRVSCARFSLEMGPSRNLESRFPRAETTGDRLQRRLHSHCPLIWSLARNISVGRRRRGREDRPIGKSRAAAVAAVTDAEPFTPQAHFFSAAVGQAVRQAGSLGHMKPTPSLPPASLARLTPELTVTHLGWMARQSQSVSLSGKVIPIKIAIFSLS